MDINAAWLDLSQAVENEDWERAAEIAEDILGWLKRDGFPPTITADRRFNKLVAQLAAQAIATWEVELVEAPGPLPRAEGHFNGAIARLAWG